MKKQTKLNPQEIERLIDEGYEKQWLYLEPNANHIKFTIPSIDSDNRFIFLNEHYHIVDNSGQVKKGGEHGKVKIYYIPKSKYSELIHVFEEYNFPQNIKNDLTYNHINMHFAANSSHVKTKIENNLDKGYNELIHILKILEKAANNEIVLERLSIDYRYKETCQKNNTNPVTNIKFQHYLSLNLILDLMKNYRSIDDIDINESLAEYSLNKKNSPKVFKNKLKEFQSRYARNLFSYIRHYVSGLAFDEFSQTTNWEQSIKTIKKQFPRNKLYLIVGKLMIISELLEMKENYIDDDIIDVIRKKIEKSLQSERKGNVSIDEQNKESNSNKIIGTNLDSLF